MGNHGSNLDDILAEDMHHWYNKFMKESPSGLITLFELKAILNLKGITENANSYVELCLPLQAIQDITRNRDIDPEEIVTLIYEKIDVKGEGELTLEEFIDGAKEHPDIMDMLRNLMDLTPVLEIIVKGRQPAVEN
ncbi:guanylyl cyclase-activating protein 1-like [Poecilia reticulata]|uniref:guanylyl cyclase-activating protein 1-like n=1 Tax=Poecilia reticulata TaxID=8081 RepID=UPI0004A36351|nr:PREDICTED: guanylyl cyclase-activating protein 1-like [Poecilia reticulata]